MLFNSSIFLFAFLPVVFILYYVAGTFADRRISLFVLVAASFFFYGWWNPSLVWLITFSVLFNFACGLGIATTRRGTSATTLFVLGIAVNLGLLAVFKYAGFFATTVNVLLDLGVPVPEIVLPIAISFFTFQQIAYLADVRQDRKAERSLLQYALFVTFFPQLIAGPIVHHKEVRPQYENNPARRLSMNLLALGRTIFTIGLFKKMIIADTVALNARAAFAAAAAGKPISLFESWTAALSYTFQIYFDFSGYSDMAIGLGLMFGIKLPVNFFSPYKATSIIDFWRRWHMTLSRFLRDYLYFPLGGNRKGRGRRYINLLVTMLLGGLWHGAGLTFIVWGALHGFYLVVNHLWRRLKPGRTATGKSSRLGIWAARLLTFLAVVLAWVFFRAENMETALFMLSSMFGLNGVTLPLSLKPALGQLAPALEAYGFAFTGMFSNNVVRNPAAALLILVLLFGVVWVMPSTAHLLRAFDDGKTWLPRLVHESDERTVAWQPSIKWSVSIGAAFALCVLSLSRVSEFIYFNF